MLKHDMRTREKHTLCTSDPECAHSIVRAALCDPMMSLCNKARPLWPRRMRGWLAVYEWGRTRRILPPEQAGIPSRACKQWPGRCKVTRRALLLS